MFSRKKNRYKTNRPRKPSRLANGIIDTDKGAGSRKHKPDYMLVLVCLALLIVGVVVMYSISPGLAAAEGISQNYYITKQFVAIGLGVIAFFLFSSVSLEFVKRTKRSFVWISLFMVVAVQLFGEKVNGAYRWIQVGGISFQVAELLKLTLIIWLAVFIVNRLANDEIKSTQKTLKPLLYILGLIGIVVASPFLQSDLGSAGVMVAILAVMAFSAGMPIKRLVMVGAIIVVGTFLLIASTPYRRDRLATYLNPTADCQSTGYQSCQALIAVGSGGMFGLGIGNGVQAYGYLPEAENDSIFAIIGEKFGFVGSSIIIGLYAFLFSRMRQIIIKTSDVFSRLYVIGVITWISTQTIINIGAMIGLLPLKGITLPLISYGGTSLVFVLAAIGIVFQISRYTAYAPIRNVTLNERGRSG